MYLFETLDPHPPTATTILGRSPKKTGFYWMVIFTKKFGTLDPHLPIVWDKVQKNGFFFNPSLTEQSFFLLKVNKKKILRPPLAESYTYAQITKVDVPITLAINNTRSQKTSDNFVYRTTFRIV